MKDATVKLHLRVPSGDIGRRTVIGKYNFCWQPFAYRIDNNNPNLSEVTKRGFADLTDVTLADEDTNSILTDDANRAIQGKLAMQVANLMSKFWWPNLQPIQVAPSAFDLNQFEIFWLKKISQVMESIPGSVVPLARFIQVFPSLFA